jgi:hypothetical protein
MSILPDDPTQVPYPLDWGADGDLAAPNAFVETSIPNGVALTGPYLGWLLRHLYHLLATLFGGTIGERKTRIWPGLFPWMTASPILLPLNQNNDSTDTFSQLLSFGHGQPTRTLTTQFNVTESTQVKAIAGNQGGLMIAWATRQALMPGGRVEQVRIRVGDIGDVEALAISVLLTGSDGLVRAFPSPNPVVANAWNVCTIEPVPSPLPGGSLQNPSDDPNIPGPIDVTLNLLAAQDSGSLGTEEVMVAWDEIEVTFGT